MCLSHTDTESTNKQHSSSTFIQFKKGDVTLIWLEVGKQYWIKTVGHISVGLCLYEISVIFLLILEVNI